MAIGAINLEPPRVRGPAPLKTEVLGCDGAASARVGPYAACKRPTSRPGSRDRLFKISCTRKMDCMLLLAVSPRSAKRGSSIISAASNEPPSHSIHSRDQTRRVHSRGAVQSNMALFYSISTKAAPICTTHTAIVSRICIVSVRRAAWTTGPHPQAVCLVTQLPLLLPLLLPQPLLPPLMFLQSAVCCCCC